MLKLKKRRKLTINLVHLKIRAIHLIVLLKIRFTNSKFRQKIENSLNQVSMKIT